MSRAIARADVAIIGAGSAGLVARRQALAHGAKRVILIEGGAYGTTCARVGCMPSKLLIAAADAAAHVRAASTFGIEASATIDGEAVMRRVRRERDRFAGFVVDATERIDEDLRIRGWARFVGPTSLEVEVEGEGEPVRVEAEAIVIAAGSTPFIPPPLRGLGDRLLTSDSVFELPTLPRSLALVGTGVIGLELGQAMARLGVQTRFFDIDDRMPLVESPTMQTLARELFGARLDLHLGLEHLEAERVDEGVRLRWREADGTPGEAVYENVLAATGRRPALQRLELERAGIELDDHGAPRDWDERTMQIGELPIFMAGDITGSRPLLHEAAAEGRIAGTNAARYPDVRAEPRYLPMGVMFSDPNVAVVGTIPDREGEGRDWEVGEVDYADQGRARVMAENHGRARIYARHGCGTVLGAELIGPRAEHMAHLLAWSIAQGLTTRQALAMPYYHPVVEEGLRTAFADLGHKLKMSPKHRPLDCGPGT